MGEAYDLARRFGAELLTLGDDAYPRLLRLSSDPPPHLFLRGRLIDEDALAIAVVGSRRATAYGLDVATRIAAGLAGAGFTVVSGLARGIDAAAHRGALHAGGRTLAFLGSGLNRIYPAEHLELAEKITARGAVLSEFPFGTPPLRAHFPRRNRAIAWISWATVVIEAARDSGSLITAGLALDEGRAVYAVPGPVDAPNAAGTNALLRDGALVCRSAADIIEDLSPQLVEAAASIAAGRGAAYSPGDAGLPGGPGPDGGAGTLDGRLTPDDRLVLKHVPGTRGIDVERLGETCGLPPGRLEAVLLELEIRGLIRQLPGRRFMAKS